jgi:glycine/D-amino acid oxidase-like deaminating enzyme
MDANSRVVIAGGGTAGWLTACYLARSLGAHTSITVIESPDIGIIGVSERTFPTIRTTLQSLGIDEARFLRESSATFKQGIRFDDWVRAPRNGQQLCISLRRISPARQVCARRPTIVGKASRCMASITW